MRITEVDDYETGQETLGGLAQEATVGEGEVLGLQMDLGAAYLFIVKAGHRHHITTDNYQIFRRTNSGNFLLIIPDPKTSLLLLPESDNQELAETFSSPKKHSSPQKKLSQSTNFSPEKHSTPEKNSPQKLLKKIEELEQRLNLLQSPPGKRLTRFQKSFKESEVNDAESNNGISSECESETTGDSSFVELSDESTNCFQKSVRFDESRNSYKSNTDILLHIEPNLLNCVKGWIRKNRDKLTKPPYMIRNNTTDDEFLLDVLFALNPLVKIEEEMFLDKNYLHDYPNRIRQEEFAKELGLVHVNDKMLTIQSQKSFRKRKSMRTIEKEVAEKIKLLRENEEEEEKSKSNNESKSKKYLSPSSSSSSSTSVKSKFYKPKDDRKIIKYVLKDERSRAVKSVNLWKALEKRKIIEGRSWGSLKERYLKIILPNLRNYGLTREQELKLKIGARKGLLKYKTPKIKLSDPMLNKKGKKHKVSNSPSSKSSKSSNNKKKSDSEVKYRFSSSFSKMINKAALPKEKKWRKLFSDKS